jgi:cell division septal protein FtsQ
LGEISQNVAEFDAPHISPVSAAMSAVLDPVAHRRARVRAVAASVVDQTPSPDRFKWTVDELVPSARKRAHSGKSVTLTGPGYFTARRTTATSVLGLQFLALLCALFLPVFRVGKVNISGAELLSSTAVESTAGIDGQSIFTVDGDTVRERLLSLPWIRSATVSTSLPGTVNISITEWSPTLRTVHGNSDMLLADDGAVVNASVAKHEALASIPLLVDSRSGPTTVPPPSVVRMLDQTVSRFPAVLGVEVAAFQWQADGRFAIWTQSGWEAILGHIDTSDEIASIPGKLASLAALRGTLNFLHPNFGYIDLEAPDTPAVGGTPGIPADINAALTAPLVPPPAPKVVTPSHSVVVPKATAAPTPRPTATPTPAPTQTPYVFVLLPASKPQH